eukprot:gene9086-18827_t
MSVFYRKDKAEVTENLNQSEFDSSDQAGRGNVFVPKIRINADGFKELVQKSNLIVDKSLLISEFLLDNSKVLLLTYPRRWGKTINMNMLKTFLELEVDQYGVELPPEKKLNTRIFESGKLKDGQQVDFDIWHDKTNVDNYFGKHPIFRHIYFDSDNKKLTKFEKESLTKYFSGDLEINDIESSIRFLSRILHIHFGTKVFILIDEYDSPINCANFKFQNQDDIDKTIGLFRVLFGKALKGNEFLEKALVTGVLRIAKTDLFSGVNNFTEYSISTWKYSDYYGFTQKEVDELLCNYSVGANIKKDIKDWYNGYNCSGVEIYSPISILKCLDDLCLQCRINRGRTDLQILYFGGYLTSGNGTNKFRLPNKEISLVFGKKLIAYYSVIYNIPPYDYENVTESIQNILNEPNDHAIKLKITALETEFAKLLKKFPLFEKVGKDHITDSPEKAVKICHVNEDLVHSIMNCTILQVRSIASFATEIYVGDGKADIVFIDDDSVNQKAVIMEMKYAGSSEAVLKQIVEKKYSKGLVGKYRTVLLGVIVDEDKSVQISYKLEGPDNVVVAEELTSETQP